GWWRVFRVLGRVVMVGLAGLEPATFRPPDGRATRLRYSPTMRLSYSFSERGQGLNPIILSALASYFQIDFPLRAMRARRSTRRRITSAIRGFSAMVARGPAVANALSAEGSAA